MGSLLLAVLLQVDAIFTSLVPILTVYIAFWSVRVQQSGILPRHTKIPDTPNQDEFTKRWLEFHQGYRIVQTSDGRQERIAVSGEPLKDVDPGVMPRTLDELRAGRLTGTEVAPVADNPPALAEVDSGPSLDEALDQLLGEALTEEGQVQPQTNREVEAEVRNVDQNGTQPGIEGAASIPTPTPSMTGAELATLRHEIEQVRRQIEAEERDDEARQAEMVADAEDMAQTQQRIEEYQREANSLRRRMARYERYLVNEQAHSEAVEERMSGREEALAQIGERVRVLRQQLRHYRRRAAGEGNFARVFGTREDIQSEDYVSPITNMFLRVNEWGRRRQAPTTTPQEPILPRAQAETPPNQLPNLRQQFEARLQEVAQRRPRQQLEAVTVQEVRLAQRQRNSDRALNRVPPVPGELSPLDLHLSALGALGSPQSPNPIDIPNLPASPGDPIRVAGAVLGTPTNWSGTDPELSPSTNFAGTIPHADRDNWLPPPADPSPETDLNNWLTAREYVPDTRVHTRAPDQHTFAAPPRRLQLSDFRSASSDRDSSDEDDSPRLSARRERIRREARQQFPDRHQDFRSILSGNTDETGDNGSRNEVFEATIAAYTTERRQRFPTLTRAMRVPTTTTPQPPRGLDIADARPDAKTDEEMMVKAECKICLSQVADTACLPCGHLCMCCWCADQAVPVKKEDRTRPVRKGIKCPVCRENVKSRAKIFV